MICDHFINSLERCKLTPTRAPRLVVFSKTPFEPEHKPLKMFTTLHYCELHAGEVKLEDLLQPKIKLDFEAAARMKRPLDFKCDFEGSIVEYVLVSTPEYRRFMAAMGYHGMMGAAKLDLKTQEQVRKAIGTTRLAT